MEAVGRRRLRCFGWAAATIAVGVVWRTVPLGMRAVAVKYGGSALWAAMLYLLVAGLRPAWQARRVAFAAGCVAFAVESFKLVPGEALDEFRRTLAGRLLLGRVFGGWDLVVYAAVIGLCGGVDWGWRRAGELGPADEV